MKNAIEYRDVLVELRKDIERAWRKSRPAQRRATEAELAYWMKLIDDALGPAREILTSRSPSPPPGPHENAKI